MSADYDVLDATVSQAILTTEQKTPEELRGLILALNEAVCGNRVSPNSLETLAREIEARYGVSMGLGAVVDDNDFVDWLDDARREDAQTGVKPFYWPRYKNLIVKNGLPKDVVTKLDLVTDTILKRLGNPRSSDAWDRRGMVVGHVQSGKTANYSGLICKAADAGYRLIIVIAGIHNNLRNQTQERIDEGFIGRDTGRMGAGGNRPKIIGVGQYGDTRIPVSLTTALSDFNKSTATNNKSQIESYNVPVVLVIKKNVHTLRNLIDWLKENSSKGDAEMIDQPMLLIDDEADNASINTKYSSKPGSDSDPTRINGQIRELLNVFHRSCYIGYTATPFANIFIDPDSESEMYGEDLYPKHFIVGLDAPSNYFGGKKVFVDGLPEEGEPKYLRYIQDNEDVLPITHRIDQTLDEIPHSLVCALRTFLIGRAIRNLRGQTENHASMLVNASRFTGVQGLIRNRIHEKLDEILNALRINGALGRLGLKDPEVAALKAVWVREYGNLEFTWDEIQGSLLSAVASAKVVEVNSSSREGLDYGSKGQTIIAVGGFSLSRGLTLEGLMVTWFLRNTKMYDTLMQMGRWFGYRMGYEDLCRVWMPSEAIEWYSHIAQASEELHDELRNMEKAKATPMQFGLAVRSHPSALMVTARNKLGAGQKTVSVGLSSQFVETARLSTSVKSLAQNRVAAKTFIQNVAAAGFIPESAKKVSGGKLLERVDVVYVDSFLRSFVNADESITTQIPPLRKYIKNRAFDELKEWDILIGSLEKGDENLSLGWPIVPMQRRIRIEDLQHGFLSIGGRKMRVSSRGVERVGVSDLDARIVETNYREIEKPQNKVKTNYPGYIYRPVRPRPLLALYLVSVNAPKEHEGPIPDGLPKEPVVAWAISFPKSSRPDERVEYLINTVRQRELFGEPDVDEDWENEDE